LELRKLFALMGCSNSSFVDPSRAVEILRDGAKGHQDVAEYLQKILEWLKARSL